MRVAVASRASSPAEPASARSASELRRQRPHVLRCEIDRLLGDGATFDLVARQQVLASPTLQYGGQLPPDVHGVADRGVEPVTSPRRVLVGGIANQEYPVAPIRVGHQHASGPRIGRHDLDLDVVGTAPDESTRQSCRVGVPGVGVHTYRHAPPGVAEAHPSEQTGRLRIEDPVVHRGACGTFRAAARNTRLKLQRTSAVPS
jgi:hypothetical protein